MTGWVLLGVALGALAFGFVVMIVILCVAGALT